jgi:hypothetical protein
MVYCGAKSRFGKLPHLLISKFQAQFNTTLVYND